MANLDSNLIAQPGFVVKNDGNGQTLTIQVAPKIVPSSDFPATPNSQIGWGDIDFSFAPCLKMAVVTANDLSPQATYKYPVPFSVSPAVTDYGRMNEDGVFTNAERVIGVYNFLNFINKNPVHVTAMNIRASNVASIPTQIIVLTPNPFSGQMERQIIDIASKKTAYQYQNDIITIGDLDLFLCRDSIVRFSSNFTHTITATDGVTTDIPLYIDIVIDYYLSLEKGLQENSRLLKTLSGQIVNRLEIAENAAAEISPNTINYTAATKLNEQGIQNAAYVNPTAAALGLQVKSRR